MNMKKKCMDPFCSWLSSVTTSRRSPDHLQKSFLPSHHVLGFLKTLTGCIFGLLTNHCHVMDCCCRCFWTFSPILDQSWRVILRWLLQAYIECIGVGLGISVFWLFAAEHLLILHMFVCHFIILELGSASAILGLIIQSFSGVELCLMFRPYSHHLLVTA